MIYVAFLQSQMLVGEISRFPASRSPHDEALLDKERFVYLLKRSLILSYRCCNRIRTYRTTLELGYDGLQNLVVYCVQSPLVDVKGIKRITGDFKVDGAASHDLCEVSYPSQQRVRYTRRSAASEGNLIGSVLRDTYL